MTIKEIIELQNESGKLYLLRQGLFYRGYNQAAAFLCEALGYRLMSKVVKSCGKRLFYVGFPAGAVDKITGMIRQRHGTVEKCTENSLVISGIPVSYDETALSDKVTPRRVYPAKKELHQDKKASLYEEIAGFPLMGSTPVECMNFIAHLQERLLTFSL